MNDMGKSILAKDTYGLAELMDQGKVFYVSQHTKVLVIGGTIGRTGGVGGRGSVSGSGRRGAEY